jgi:AbrB family looped-hinge helix DNA binding protein
VASKEYKARITSKNQLTLPSGISALLHVGPGDTLNFEVGKDGTVIVTPPSVRERLAPIIGVHRRGKGMSIDQINSEVRRLRGREDDRD